MRPGIAVHRRNRAAGGAPVPALQASAARTAGSGTVIALVNLDPHHDAHVAAPQVGWHAVSGAILTAGAMDAHKTFDHPAAVTPDVFADAVLSSGSLEIALPAKAVVVLELK